MTQLRLTVTGSYIRHSDQAHCTSTVDVTVGHLKDAWAALHVPGHRLWRLEIQTVNGAPFAEWHKDNPIPAPRSFEVHRGQPAAKKRKK